MTTFKLLPHDMLQEIDAVLRRHQDQTLPVYAEAERLRRRWKHLNIALEDILNRLVEGSGPYNIAVAFNPEEAKGALLGTPDMAETAAQDNEPQYSKSALQ